MKLVARATRQTATRPMVGSRKISKRTVFTLPSVPFNIEAGLKPCVSAKALHTHYHKVHLGYVLRTNSLVAGSKHETKSLEEIVRHTGSDASEAALHHNAAQLWNHNFLWKTVTPVPTQIGAPLNSALTLHFGSEERFKSTFMQHAMAVFGSGYTWLVDNDGHLQVVNTFNGQTMYGRPRVTPLLVCDVWEHAYWTDFEDRRTEYLNNWWKIINWDFVQQELLKIDRSARFPSGSKDNQVPWRITEDLVFTKKDRND